MEKRTNIIYYPEKSEWRKLLRREKKTSKEDYGTGLIIGNIERGGDKALLSYLKIFDSLNINASDLKVKPEEFAEAESMVSEELKSAIDCAISNVRKFHAAQKREDIAVETLPGVVCKQKSIPINRVGLYIPGGTAPLFSTVIMLAVPAQIAGCKEIVLCTPVGRNGKIAPEVLYCSKVCGVTEVFRAGGPAAIGAMAYGTETIPAVDKIFGPGNSYVTAAKQIVSKDICAIDMPAGPSEVMILADSSAVPEFITADFLAQLEHGKESQAVLVTTSEELAKRTQEELEKQLSSLSRQEYIIESLGRSVIVVLDNEDDMIDMANEYAPEHLIICTEEYSKTAEMITNAGSIFLGNYTPESAGDYASGTNHTLPTGGWAKSFSGVNLDSFTKKITIQEITGDGLERLGAVIEAMANAEGLDAHANSVKVRLKILSQN
ncbi:MAG: histidinol dehydrogenase [Bacteroidales bacterium]|nr:histidinol dehydrogenase [Bacteroidales bacterium]